MTKQPLQEALASVPAWSDEKLVGQLFSVASGGHAAQDIMGFGATDRESIPRLKTYIRDYHLGAVIYFPPGGDHEPVADIRRDMEDLQSAAEIPVLISTDQENGTVARVRVGATHMPGNMALGATQDPELWRSVAEITAEQLRAVGISQTFAPVADLNVLSANPGINIRSAGSDPQKASHQLQVIVEGLAAGGVASTLKHFPGYGSAATDPHFGLPSVPLSREEWDATERLPFQAAIDAGADAVMLGHVAFPELDDTYAATFSSAIIRGLLRQDLGFQGVIVTDAMDMGGAQWPAGPHEACVAALAAGADQVLMPRSFPDAYQAVLRALQDGRLDRRELEESARRILRLKLKLGLDQPNLPELTVFDDPRHVAIARDAAAKSMTWRAPETTYVLPADAPVTIINPGVDPQKRGVNPGEVLGDVVRRAGHPVELVDWEDRARVQGGHVIVMLRDAWKDELPVAETLAQLSDAGAEVCVVALRSPFESAGVSRRYPLLLTYGDNEYAVVATAHVLLGQAEARGAHAMAVTDLETSGQQ